MAPAAVARTFRRMKRRFLFTGLFCGLLVLALAGWAVQGVRWTVARPRPRATPAERGARASYLTRVATS